MTITLPDSPLTAEQAAHCRLWIAALRSGEYQQTKGALHRLVPGDAPGGGLPAGWCCLGVACDVAAEHITLHRSSNERYEAFDGIEGLLPNTVKQWLGIIEQSLLTEANDGAGATFPEIADALEAWVARNEPQVAA